MRVKKSTLQITAMILSVGVLFVLLFSAISYKQPISRRDAIDIVDGKQIITIVVNGGYSPNRIKAQANVPTTVSFVTKNTYDCSAALIVPKLNVDRILPATGTTSLEIPDTSSGSKLTGSCSMGMYGFEIEFE